MQIAPNQKQIAILLIVYNFNIWAAYSKSKNFPSMFALVLPNSNFYQLSLACQKSHNTGITYFYKFEGLEIVSLSKTKTEAGIRGIIVLNMVGVDIKYKGQFMSSCRRETSSMDWKLNDIEIDWE